MVVAISVMSISVSVYSVQRIVTASSMRAGSRRGTAHVASTVVQKNSSLSLSTWYIQ